MPSYGNLIRGSDGNLYGVTASGGNSAAQCGTYGCGTVFRLSPTGVFATLYAFCNSKPNCSDGLFPSSLIEGSDGNFYGVTEQGGTNTYQACGGGSGCGAGTVFRLTPAGVLTTLYSFCNQADCTDGANPNAPPLQGSDGNFYGTTLSGGLSGCDGYGCGTVYKITSSGTLTTLYRFCNTANCADGVGPFAALVEGPDGDFYGTTSGQYAGSSVGAGDPGQTAFKITPTGTLTTLYTFCSQSNCTDGDGHIKLYCWHPTAISMAPPAVVERTAQIATVTVAVRFLRSVRPELLAPFIAFAAQPTPDAGKSAPGWIDSGE